ncbi:MAG TPA: CPBP family intramembrane metalloprotease [Bacillota bacterium]|nr:CPBP family intramembrane metalloprotease [Bacillota bacterium]
MEAFLQVVINSIIEIIIFSIVPLIWWLATAKKKMNFFEWIGLHKFSISKESKTPLWIVSTTAVFLLVSLFILYSIRNVSTATSSFSGMGIAAIPAVIVYGLFNTSLPEEILFRGFLLKRFSNKLGFTVGNILQSILFALLHGVMFFSKTSLWQTILITLLTGTIAWCMGYINEKKADGSILPSWIIHASANVFSALCSAFLLFQ